MSLVGQFKLEIKALAKERPRMTRGGHTYTPKRTKEYEQQVRNWAISKLPAHHKVPTEPVKMYVSTVDAVPQSWKMEDRVAALMGRLYPKKGDLDNRVKAIQDALNGVYYVDDVQIVQLDARMSYGPTNSVTVAVYKIHGSIDETDNEGGVGVGG